MLHPILPEKSPSKYPINLEKLFEASTIKNAALLRPSHSVRTGTSTSKKLWLLLRILAILLCLYSFPTWLSYGLDLYDLSHQRPIEQDDVLDFYHNISRPRFSCVMKDGQPASFSGIIGLEGDTEETPKRSFFWYHEAENNPQDAPIVMSIGGGPGASGLMNGMNGQSRCIVTELSIEYNPNGWNEHVNLLLLDHPINVGYSYGTQVNNSRDAAIDAYDFLQKFFRLFPDLRKNKLVLSGGSYGGIYIPNIAHVIHENNKAMLNGVVNSTHNLPINIDSIMLSNPISEPFVYHEWALEYRCVMHQVYNSTTCNTMYSNLPKCLEAIGLAYEHSNVYYRASAEKICYKYFDNVSPDVVLEDVRRKCRATPEDPVRCHPMFAWTNNFFRNESTKTALGLPSDREFFALNVKVMGDFAAYGDRMQPHQNLLIPLMKDGIRVLHFVGAQDASCSWPGVLSSLKQLRSLHQAAFLSTPEISWDSGLNQKVTIRQVGKGAGDFTYILVDDAGHFVVHDQPRLTKMIAEHWIRNIPFLNVSADNGPNITA